MSENTEQEIEHTLPPVVPEATLPNQVGASGDLTYGFPFLKTLTNNSWFANIAQEFAIMSFTWSTSAESGTLITGGALRPYLTGNLLPWFPWFLSFHHSYKCDFWLEIEIIAHTSHRGSLSVFLTGRIPENEHVANRFLPHQLCDISGGVHNFRIKIPNMYTSMQKLVDPLRAQQVAPNVRFLFLDHYLCASRVIVDSPLIGSAFLPNSVTGIVKLVPDISTLKVTGSQRPLEIALASPSTTYTV